METYRKISNTMNTGMYKAFGYSSILTGIVYFLITLYISMLSPKVPPVVESVFNNGFFKVLVFTIILWTSRIDPPVAILISVAFLLTMNYVNNKPLWEFVDNVGSVTVGQTVVTNQEDAVNASVATLTQSAEEPVSVSNVVVNPGATVVTPTITDNVVTIPSIVVSPIAVQTSEGEKMYISPNVTVLKPDGQEDADSQPLVQTVPGCYQYATFDITKVRPVEKSENYSLL